MPRKKKLIAPVEIIHCNDFDIEVMQDGWDIKGRGSNNKKAFQRRLDEILLLLTEDFVDKNGNLRPLIKRTNDVDQKNDYLLNSKDFSERCESLKINYIWETDQQLKRAYFQIIAKELKKNILIKLNASPPPPTFPIRELREYLDKI